MVRCHGPEDRRLRAEAVLSASTDVCVRMLILLDAMAETAEDGEIARNYIAVAVQALALLDGVRINASRAVSREGADA